MRSRALTLLFVCILPLAPLAGADEDKQAVNKEYSDEYSTTAKNDDSNKKFQDIIDDLFQSLCPEGTEFYVNTQTCEGAL